MAFKIERFGSDSSNAKSMLGGINYYRYYNKENDTVTNAGYFPADLGLEVGDRICVTPKVVTDADKWYVVSNITNRTITVSELGSDVDLSKVVNADVLPTASADENGKVYLYTGETDESYTHGYVYECQATPVYDSTVEFNPASLSSTTAACSGSDFAALVARWGTGAIDTIIKGTLTYDESGELLVFVGQDDTDTTVCTFQLYAQDYIDAGFTFTGTFQDGDVIAFTCTIEQTGYSYAWARINTQPQPEKELPTQAGNSGKYLKTNGVSASWAAVEALPDQSGQSGKFLTTNGSAASWATINALQNKAEASSSFSLDSMPSNKMYCTVLGIYSSAGAGAWAVTNGTACGYSTSVGDSCTCIGASAQSGSAAFSNSKYNIAIGKSAKAGTVNNVSNAIQIGAPAAGATNNDANTFKVGNANGNFELMSADGTIPAARHASLPVADGTYVLKLTISGGVPTLAWVAE